MTRIAAKEPAPVASILNSAPPPKPEQPQIFNSPLDSLAAKLSTTKDVLFRELHTRLTVKVKEGNQYVWRKPNDSEVFQYAVLCDQYGLNPFTNQLHAFVGKDGKLNGIVGIDGWISICQANPAYDGCDGPTVEFDANREPISATTTIYRKDRSRPMTKTEYVVECKRATEPWNMVARMIGHKSFIQCARYAFGLPNLYDEDEAEKIMEGVDWEGTETRLKREPRAASAVAAQKLDTVRPADDEIPFGKDPTTVDGAIAAAAKERFDALVKSEPEATEPEAPQYDLPPLEPETGALPGLTAAKGPRRGHAT